MGTITTKIFSRWVKQKLLRTRPEIQVNDVVDDYKDGVMLLNLIEVLSESKFEGKYNQRPKMSVHRIDNLNNALKFAWSKGVDMKVKPSAEQLEKGDQKAALALTWGIMMKFIKIDDGSGGEALNAKDALMMWCKNKTAGYKGVEITDFKKSFADGYALCAIIHKHRPKLIDLSSLDPNDPIKNLQIAQDAAEKYFGLEKYITPDEIRKLDENSMVVYVSEYYYGIAEQRKLDLAARRIKKLIVLTKENDRLKTEYNKTAKNFKDTLKRVEVVLEDRTIDNTMAGAKLRLEKFYEYKTKEKSSLISDQLDLESNYNNLAMRLAHHKRPEFKPEKGCSLKEVAQDMLHLEECEQERKVALHAELNRQLKLVNLATQHESRFNKLSDYFNEKQAYLNLREEIDSVSAAHFQLRLLDRYQKENETMIKTGVANLKSLSAELKQEKYEYQAHIEDHDKDIDAKFKKLDELARIKKPILDDHLKREEFIVKVRQMNDEHKDKYNKLVKWFQIKNAYLLIKEEIDSVTLASKNLNIFGSYVKEYEKYKDYDLVEFIKLGKEILAQEYKTEYSHYVYDITEYQGKSFNQNRFADITNRHDDMNAKFKELSELASEKKAILDDHLKREEFIEKVRQMNVEHDDKYKKLITWFNLKKAYLDIKEEINSVTLASKNLNIFGSYAKEYEKYKENDLVEFIKLGKEILAQEYKTDLSHYVYDITEYQGKSFNQNRFADITNRHDDMDAKFKELSELASEKKAILDDHLKREEFIEKVRQMNVEHDDKYKKLVKWFEIKKAYLIIKEEINSVTLASKNLNIFASYAKEYEKYKENDLVEFIKLGKEILAQEYKTDLSHYVYDITEYQGKSFNQNRFADITNRHDDTNAKFKELSELASEKKAILDDHLKREQFIEKVRQMNDEHEEKYKRLVEWFEIKKAYLIIKEEINSTSEARTQLNLFNIYAKEYEDYNENDLVEFIKLGKEILAQEYKTDLSHYVYDITEYQGKSFNQNRFADITNRNDDTNAKFKELSELASEKKTILDDHLKREEFIETVRQMNVEHEDRYSKLVKWFDIKKAYLVIKEEINSVAEARTQLNLFNIYSKEYENYNENDLVEFIKLGKEILAQEYKTDLSHYVYDITEYQGKSFNQNRFADITNRNDDTNAKFKELSELASEKKAILDDHLKREEFIETVRQMNVEHEDRYSKLVEWFDIKKAYLDIKEEINSVSEAQTQLNLFGSYMKEYEKYKEYDIVELAKLGKDLMAQEYKTEHSHYVYDITEYQGKSFNQNRFADITNRHDDMDAKFKQLSELANEKKGYLDEQLRLETKKEELRLEFANLISEFTAYVKLEIENASLREFGFTLEEVEAYKKVINETDKQVLGNASKMKESCEKVKVEMDEYKVTNNPYTGLTIKDSATSFQTLQDALSERTKAYEAELKRQRENDELCKKFAQLADPFSKWITEQKDQITASKESLEVQLAFVDKCISSLSTEQAKLQPLKDLQEKMDKAGIQNNRHTTLTLKDLLVQWGQYENFLKRKKKMLEEEIEHQKLRGITAEQMQEIEENFKQFDFDNSGTIDRKELTACLYSLGEERTPKEINKIMEEYGDGKDISYERFKDFMIVLFGDTDTKDEIINSFILINRGHKVAKKDLMELVMDDQDIEYILKTAPQVDEGYNYHAWTEEVFSR